MADEKALWTAIQSIHDKIKSDSQFAATFDKSPTTALKGSNLDAVVPATSVNSETHLSDLLAGMTDIERRATIEAIVGSRQESGHQALALAVANANAGANANALANANANANANTNTNGFAAIDLKGDLVRLTLGQGFAGTDVAKRFKDMKLSEARQQALLKSVFADSNSIVHRGAGATGDIQRAVGSFRGTSFEVEAVINGPDIQVTGARILK